MAIAPMDIPVTDQLLMVVPWLDPVVDSVGYDVRSQYVELFWLNVLGPTATWILRRLVLGFDRYPLGYELDLEETASALGLSYTVGTANSFMRSLNRCVLFGVSQPTEGGLAVRRRVPPVATRHLMRMPAHLRQAHQQWSVPDHAHLARRSRTGPRPGRGDGRNRRRSRRGRASTAGPRRAPCCGDRGDVDGDQRWLPPDAA